MFNVMIWSPLIETEYLFKISETGMTALLEEVQALELVYGDVCAVPSSGNDFGVQNDLLAAEPADYSIDRTNPNLFQFSGSCDGDCVTLDETSKRQLRRFMNIHGSIKASES
ncbi:hypothetical protein ACE6H2_022947 [Prunus campanulata]